MSLLYELCAVEGVESRKGIIERNRAIPFLELAIRGEHTLAHSYVELMNEKSSIMREPKEAQFRYLIGEPVPERATPQSTGVIGYRTRVTAMLSMIGGAFAGVLVNVLARSHPEFEVISPTITHTLPLSLGVMGFAMGSIIQQEIAATIYAYAQKDYQTKISKLDDIIKNVYTLR
jgi:hypothetical protein